MFVFLAGCSGTCPFSAQSVTLHARENNTPSREGFSAPALERGSRIFGPTRTDTAEMRSTSLNLIVGSCLVGAEQFFRRLLWTTLLFSLPQVPAPRK